MSADGAIPGSDPEPASLPHAPHFERTAPDDVDGPRVDGPGADRAGGVRNTGQAPSSSVHPAGIDPGSGDEGGESFIAFLKDNFEAIAVAVIMALVIKHFCVEAFKIPTSSMLPVLHGENDNESGEGDRILVDKFAYIASDPQRWDVLVFRYPLNTARNFIKRVAGLPGERLRISSEGDIWVRNAATTEDEDDLRIPPRPRSVRNEFYRPVYPPPFDEDDDEETRRAALRALWEGHGERLNGWRVESAEHFDFVGGSAAELRSRRSITEDTDPDTWAHGGGGRRYVRDVRIRATIRFPEAGPDAAKSLQEDSTGEGNNEEGHAEGQAADPALPGQPAALVPTTVALSWRPDGEFLAVLRLSTEPGGSEVFLRRGTEIVASRKLDVQLTPNGATQIELEYVDGNLRARVDDHELAVLADGRRWSDTQSAGGDQYLGLEAAGAPLSVDDLRIDRDQGYENSWTNREAEIAGVEIPNESYFMLGDNTRNSSDSRKWRMTTQHLRGGRSIRYMEGDQEYVDDDEAPTPGIWKRVVDADGITRLWHEDEEDPDLGETSAPAPFVKRDLIVGRAFLIFWPCRPDFPGRLGFIH